MTTNGSSSLSEHMKALCRAPRTPGSPGYLESQIYICETLQSLGFDVLEQRFSPLLVGPSLNIYARLDSSAGSSEKGILLGGHYETLCSSGVGADDNASAVAVILELARRFKENPPATPVTFCFFDLEENYRLGGLRGSEAFASHFADRFQEVIILDLVGGHFAPHMESAYFQFGDSRPPLQHSDLEFMHLPIKVLEPLGAWGSMGPRSDYYAFRKRGVPYTFLSSGTPWYYHTENDNLDRIDFEKMEKLCEVLEKEIYKGCSSTPHIPSWNSFHRLTELISKTPQLQSKELQLMMERKAEPDRLQMVRFHIQVLKKLREFGPSLWAA